MPDFIYLLTAAARANRAQYSEILFQTIPDDDMIREVRLPSMQGAAEEEGIRLIAHSILATLNRCFSFECLVRLNSSRQLRRECFLDTITARRRPCYSHSFTALEVANITQSRSYSGKTILSAP